MLLLDLDVNNFSLTSGGFELHWKKNEVFH